MDIAVWNSIFMAVIYFLYFAVILTTIFVVMAGGYLWGIAGTIFAIPLAAVLILLCKYVSGRVFASDQELSP